MLRQVNAVRLPLPSWIQEENSCDPDAKRLVIEEGMKT
jgi:hypothetical protein